MTSRQCVAARAMLGWKQQTLAFNAGVGLSTIASFERGNRQTKRPQRRAIVAALERAGVRLISDCGLVVV